jgi:hypothetical protein
MDEQKTREQRINEFLDKPAIEAVNSIKGPSLADQFQPEEVKTDATNEAADDDSGDKKIRIRKSRLNTLETELADLRAKTQEANSFKTRVAALEEQLSRSSQTEEVLPDWWKEAYGDNDVSKKGYANQQRIFREELTREFERREAERQAAEAQRSEQISAIESSFDEQMDELEESIGRELTSKQKEELLVIVGEYSPTDDEGKYLAYMPVDKAYALWSKGQGTDTGKREMAQIAGLQSSGGTVDTNSDWRPGGWRQKYGL